jgi:RNA polymerase sigma-70 factor (ECF subfamily)
LDPRLRGRLDESDVLQESYLDAIRRFAEYEANPSVPLFVWVRSLTLQRMVDLHRYHLGAQVRDVGREISLCAGPMPEACSVSLAAQLVGRLTTPSQAAVRIERQLAVQSALAAMEPLDREILALRHFEMLTNEETSQVLAIKPKTASKRYIRALQRLKEVLSGTDTSSHTRR